MKIITTWKMLVELNKEFIYTVITSVYKKCAH